MKYLLSLSTLFLLTTIVKAQCGAMFSVEWLSGAPGTANSCNFGTVPVGQSTTYRIRIRNNNGFHTGNLYLRPLISPGISPFSINPIGGGGTAELSGTLYTLPNNDYKDFDVTFTPTTASAVTKTWHIAHNGANLYLQNPALITLSGTGTTAPCSGTTLTTTGLTGTAPALFCNFGNVCPGAVITKAVRITNAPTSCFDLTFTPSDLSTPFAENASGSYTKNPADYQNIVVTFTAPMTTGVFSQPWSISNNSTNLSPLNITVKGTVVSATAVSMTVGGPGLSGGSGPNPTLSFGNASLTASPLTSSRTIRITNTSPLGCGLDLNLSGWPLIAGPYTVTTTYVSNSPITPTNYADFVFTFDPTITGGTGTTNYQTWTITHNATNIPFPHLNLRGTGIY